MQDGRDPTVEKGWNWDRGYIPSFWKRTKSIVAQQWHAICKLCLGDAKTSNGGWSPQKQDLGPGLEAAAKPLVGKPVAAQRRTGMDSVWWLAQSSAAYETEELCTAKGTGGQWGPVSVNTQRPLYPVSWGLWASNHVHLRILAQQN